MDGLIDLLTSLAANVSDAAEWVRQLILLILSVIIYVADGQV